MKRKHALLLALLFTICIAINLYFFHIQTTKKMVFVTRVIDGDTFEFGDDTARLININTPEKSEKGYDEAKAYLAQLENKEVQIEELDRDKYGRILVRVYSSEYINEEIVKKGLGTKFLVQESELSSFNAAEKTAIENQRGIWQKSSLFGCITIEIEAQEEKVSLHNTCEKINLQNFIMRDESRKRYKFQNIQLVREIYLHSTRGIDNNTDLFWNSGQNVWNNDRDTAYLLDAENNIVAYSSYGY